MNNLEDRFLKFKTSILDHKNIYGSYWNLAKETFDINFENGEFKSLGKRNYLPEIYNHQMSQDYLLDINFESQENKKFLQVGEKKLCLKKSTGNASLVYDQEYFTLISKYLKKDDVVCEVGSGGGFLAALIHEKKKTINILIDIPNVILSSISLMFTLFPNCKYLLPNEVSTMSDIDFKSYDFIFLSPNQIHLIPDKSFNFCINNQSFMEMDMKEVNEYLFFFNRTTKNQGYFFCSNRTRKRHYFFNYNFQLLKNFKKIFLKKCNYHFANRELSSMINFLAVKDEKMQNNSIKFGLIDRILGIRFFKMWEFFYWLKKDLSSLKKIIIKN